MIPASTSKWLIQGPQSEPVLWYSQAQNAPPTAIQAEKNYQRGRELPLAKSKPGDTSDN